MILNWNVKLYLRSLSILDMHNFHLRSSSIQINTLFTFYVLYVMRGIFYADRFSNSSVNVALFRFIFSAYEPLINKIKFTSFKKNILEINKLV